MSAPAAPLPSNRRLILYFVLLAALLPEAITGSTPPQAWLNPIQALLNFWLYGSGVLVVREVARRWKSGWPGILLLGAAYGIVEEGLAVTTFFNPTLPQLGTLGWYGRDFGVNWLWAVWLSEFHALVSIAIPILLLEWHWPALKEKRLLSDRGLYVALALLALAAVTINVMVHLASPYREAGPEYLAALAAIALLAYAARRWSTTWWRHLPATGRPLTARGHFLLGFTFIGGSFLLYAGGPFFGRQPLISLAEGLALLGVTLLLVRRSAGRADGEVLGFAFAAGVTGFFCVFDLALVPGNPLMVLPATGFGYLVLRLWRERPISPTALPVARA
ncbi:MAG TPA: hypothetical protein VEY12_10495 [Thermoplasmata archaeon]|nr:hypothetical protein [Thermoplasmata archaeon]